MARFGKARPRVSGAESMMEAALFFVSWCVSLLRPTMAALCSGPVLASFLFLYFYKKNYRNIFLILDFTILYPYRPVGGGRDLYINKNNFFCAQVLRGSLPPSCRAAGSHHKYKTLPLPSAPSFSAHDPSLCALIFCPRDPERGEGG